MGGALSDRFGRRSVLTAMTLLALATAWPALTALANALRAFDDAERAAVIVVYLRHVQRGDDPSGADRKLCPPKCAWQVSRWPTSPGDRGVYGFTPVISTALIEYTGDKASPGYWMSFAAICGLLATCYLLSP